MKFLRSVLPHAVMILAAMFLVLLTLDWFNPHMGFISSGVSRVWLLAFCVLALINGVVCVIRDRKDYLLLNRTLPQSIPQTPRPSAADTSPETGRPSPPGRR